MKTQPAVELECVKAEFRDAIPDGVDLFSAADLCNKYETSLVSSEIQIGFWLQEVFFLPKELEIELYVNRRYVLWNRDRNLKLERTIVRKGDVLTARILSAPVDVRKVELRLMGLELAV